MISTLVLDLDGPLLDGMQRHYRCYSDIMKERRFRPIPVELYWEMKRNKVSRRILLECSDALPLYDEFLETWIDRIETKEYLELDRLQYDVMNILSKWKERELRMILATLRNDPKNLTWQLDMLDLRRFFDDVVVVGSGQDGANKASEVKAKLMDQCLDRIVWVGDTEVDVAAARELGVRVSALTCGLRTKEYLVSLSPDYIEADLHSFSEKMNKNND
jgi:phosphoglycolate phosphatase-like HAD superfamily hydrolase